MFCMLSATNPALCKIFFFSLILSQVLHSEHPLRKVQKLTPSFLSPLILLKIWFIQNTTRYQVRHPFIKGILSKWVNQVTFFTNVQGVSEKTSLQNFSETPCNSCRADRLKSTGPCRADRLRKTHKIFRRPQEKWFSQDSQFS